MTEAQVPIEQSSGSSGDSTNLEYKTPFIGHEAGEGILINPWSILRMRVKGAEICFEVKSHSNVILANWASALMTNFDFSKKITQTGIGKL